MKKLKLTTIALAMFLSLGLINNVIAMENYIVVDTQKALTDSKAFKSFQSQIQKYGAEIQADFKKEETALKTEYDALGANKANLAPKDLETKVKDIETRVNALQAKYAKKRQSFDKISMDTGKVIEEQAQKIVVALAKDLKVNTVFQGYAFVSNMYPKEKDKTAEITARLDKALPSIPVKKP